MKMFVAYPNEDVNEYTPAAIDNIDSMLSREMMQLDIKERTSIQEEIHGVGSIQREETPEFVGNAIRELIEEINLRIPVSEKQAYLRSLEMTSSYVHTKQFRLRFLRAVLFDIPVAAKRLVKFLDIVLDLFGESLLQRPVRLSDFTKEEMKQLRLGRYQFTPFGDRKGRRILLIFPDATWEAIPPASRVS